MKILGYCTSCHRVKQVRVNPATLGPGRTPQGICDACAEEAKTPRRGIRRTLEPIDETHRMCLEARGWIRDIVAELHERNARWSIRPMPADFEMDWR